MSRKLHGARDTGVVDQNLRSTPSGDSSADECLHLVSAGNVTRQGEHLAAIPGNSCRAHIELILIASGENDTAILRRESFCESRTQAAAAAGDRYNFARQPGHTHRE